MYDFVVLGGGSAGYAAARTAVELGLRTAVIDGAEELGGLCILRGCMPSKTLIESANRALVMREAARFGLCCGPVEARAEEVIRRKRELIGEFAGYRRGQLEDGRFDLIRGRACFRSPREIEVSLREGGTQRVEAASALIATGSVIAVPELPGLAEANYWTSDDVLEAERIPDSVVVLGGGAIALEMAHYLDGMGATVTVVQRSPHVLRGVDPDVASVVEAAFRDRGMDVHTGTRLLRVEPGQTGKRVVFLEDGEEETVEGEEILVALGRRPATGGLGLDSLEMKLAGRRIAVDGGQETSVRGIFAAGDVSGTLEVVHLAIEQGEMAAHNAAVGLGRLSAAKRERDDRLNLFGVFSEPQVAVVGASEGELLEAGRDYVAASYPFDDHGKSMVMGELYGFVKILAAPSTGEILGASVVGPEAVELIHEITVAMHFRATVADLVQVPHYHPTLSEIWTYPADELAETLAKRN